MTNIKEWQRETDGTSARVKPFKRGKLWNLIKLLKTS
jgi:hypothetical protein